MTEIRKPLPDVGDPLTAPFWVGTKQHRLLVPRCVHCSYRFWPPEPVCPECLTSEFAWDEIAPRGRLWSYAVYHRALDPAFAADVPYAVGLVELEGGLKMYGLLDVVLDRLAVDSAVEAEFRPETDAVTMVRWRLSD